MSSRNVQLNSMGTYEPNSTTQRLFTTSSSKKNKNQQSKGGSPSNIEYNQQPLNLNTALTKLKQIQKERKLAMTRQQMGLSSRESMVSITTAAMISPQSREISQRQSNLNFYPNNSNSGSKYLQYGNQLDSRFSSKRSSAIREASRLEKTTEINKSRNSQNATGMFKTASSLKADQKLIFDSCRDSISKNSEMQKINQSEFYLKSYDPSTQKKDTRIKRKHSKSSKEMPFTQSSKFLLQLASQQTKTIEIDLKKEKGKSAYKKNQSQTKLNSSTDSMKGLHQIHRKDHFKDNMNDFLDENLLEVARLIALKRKIQEDIFEKSKEYQGLLSDISTANMKNIELRQKIGFASEEQRHLHTYVTQLENNFDAMEEKRSEKFNSLRNGIKYFVDQKAQLKFKLRKDTSMTSNMMKSMEILRAKSTDRVSLVELKEDQALISLCQLRSMIDRGAEVEKSRMEEIRSKESILKNLMFRGGSGLNQADPKSYIRQKISKVMVETSKSRSQTSQKRIKRSTSVTIPDLKSSKDVKILVIQEIN